MHTHYVQGCSFDPFGQIVASLSADRTLRFYQQVKKNKKSKSSEWKQTIKCHALQQDDKQVRLWWDDTLPGFVRRLTWSPEGTLLAAPGAEFNKSVVSENVNEDVVKMDQGKENVEPTPKTIVSLIFYFYISFYFLRKFELKKGLKFSKQLIPKLRNESAWPFSPVVPYKRHYFYCQRLIPRLLLDGARFCLSFIRTRKMLHNFSIVWFSVSFY